MPDKRSRLVVLCLLGSFAAACGDSTAGPASTWSPHERPAPGPSAAVTLPLVNPPHGVDVHPSATALPEEFVSVTAGGTLAVEVGRSGGPLAWRLTKSGDERILGRPGRSAAGGCPAGKIGCVVPERYTFLARAAGKTTLEWSEESLACPRPSPSGVTGTCAVATARIQVIVS